MFYLTKILENSDVPNEGDSFVQIFSGTFKGALNAFGLDSGCNIMVSPV